MQNHKTGQLHFEHRKLKETIMRLGTGGYVTAIQVIGNLVHPNANFRTIMPLVDVFVEAEMQSTQPNISKNNTYPKQINNDLCTTEVLQSLAVSTSPHGLRHRTRR
jgi:hypothetical protein